LLAIVAVSKKEDLGVETTWSMRVALFGVHLVGLVTTCSRPKENSRSINSLACSPDVYLRTLILKSLKNIPQYESQVAKKLGLRRAREIGQI
jgi:hypothetical protein